MDFPSITRVNSNKVTGVTTNVLKSSLDVDTFDDFISSLPLIKINYDLTNSNQRDNPNNTQALDQESDKATFDFTMKLSTLDKPIHNFMLSFIIDHEYLKTINVYELIDRIQLINGDTMTDNITRGMLEMTNIINDTLPVTSIDPNNEHNAVVTFNVNLNCKYPDGLCPHGVLFVWYGKSCHNVVENVSLHMTQIETPCLASIDPFDDDEPDNIIKKYLLIHVTNELNRIKVNLHGTIRRIYFKSCTPMTDAQCCLQLYNHSFVFKIHHKYDQLYYCDLIINEDDYTKLMDNDFATYMAIEKVSRDGINFDTIPQPFIYLNNMKHISNLIIFTEMINTVFKDTEII